MSDQFSLPGFDGPERIFSVDKVSNRTGVLRGYSLFFAIFPTSADATSLSGQMDGIRHRHGILGKPMLPDRLHISLHAVAGFTEMVPQKVVDAALAAAGRVVCPRLPVVFDRLSGFAESTACVLQCDATSSGAISLLRKPLAAALKDVGLHPTASSAPHMTMLYRDTHEPFEYPIDPIGWTATRFALILSHVGIGHHQWINEWPLGGQAH